MKSKEISIAEALTIRYSQLGLGRKRYTPSEIKRANDFLKKAGQILGVHIEVENSDLKKTQRR